MAGGTEDQELGVLRLVEQHVGRVATRCSKGHVELRVHLAPWPRLAFEELGGRTVEVPVAPLVGWDQAELWDERFVPGVDDEERYISASSLLDGKRESRG